ncbi:hypothetical protein QCM80_40380 [Bradyrhizobium sp. SSUT112]|uniref:hypothetical protein n=1 Tax=Bradyrhizobium sp. SSUT112 TaxID=3040604 RepID=UPI00244A2ADE|nr:hypothetical protein [Bradyrhizobium sp. SSUT112]MDH2356829.1 hypothetical protein [Bradyrhizobium sp. SSUT112]
MTTKAHRNAAAQILLALTALLAAGRAVAVLSSTSQGVYLNDIANRIMSGDSFSQESIPSMERSLSTVQNRSICDPLEVRGAAIIRLRLYEDAVNASDIRLADQRLQLLRSSTDVALACVPAEGFLWFIRYWTAVRADIPAHNHFEELRMSYELAPFEGWIALRRNAYALAVYKTLPADVKEMAVKEFVAIVASGFIAEAVNVLRGSAWDIRGELLPHLERVRMDMRLRLEKRLRSEGLPLEIPGVESKEFRPWQ